MPPRRTTRRDQQRWANRGTTTQRGLGADHQATRARLLPHAIGTHCPIRGPRCDGIMTNPKRMHLDHSQPRALGGRRGDRIVCMPCNCSTGATLGNRMRGRHTRTPRPPLPQW